MADLIKIGGDTGRCFLGIAITLCGSDLEKIINHLKNY
jgi:hypothetical protein